MSEEEYCIWNAFVGQCDTSKDWNKLFGILNRNVHRFIDGKGYIVPTRLVGKDNFRTVKQMQEDSDRIYYESMERLRKINAVHYR